jgi:hypothetical protein
MVCVLTDHSNLNYLIVIRVSVCEDTDRGAYTLLKNENDYKWSFAKFYTNGGSSFDFLTHISEAF